MKFRPQMEESLDSSLLQPGIYEFHVTNAVDEVSKKGNDMITLTLRVSDGNDLSRVVTDYLLPARKFKLKRAALACGAGEQYNNGELLAQHFLDKAGKLKLGTQDPENGYPAKNVVLDYVLQKG